MELMQNENRNGKWRKKEFNGGKDIKKLKKG